MSVTSQKVELNRTVSLVVGATTKGDKLAAGDTNPASAKTLKQLEEAKAHLHRAERKVRPSFKRWKPRFSQAGEEYCKAAILFYQCGVVEESKTNLLKACECFKKKRAWYSAAKTLEQAMTISLRQVSNTFFDYTYMWYVYF